MPWKPQGDDAAPRQRPDLGPRAWSIKHTGRCEHGRFYSGTWTIRDLGRDGEPTQEDWSGSDLTDMSQACARCTPREADE